MNDRILLSICVPTYNRGGIALRLVKKLKKIAYRFPGKIEVIVSNNGSDKFLEEYDAIYNMTDEYLTYFSFDENKGFVRNYNQVIRLSRGKFCLLLSDEDFVEEEGIEFYINYLIDNPQIGIVRGKTTKMYANQYQEVYLNAGKEAIDGYFLQGNYISGIIYNRGILTNYIIDSFEKEYINNEAYRVYPHLFIEAYLCLVSDVYRGNICLISEGENQNDLLKDAIIQILPYSTLESRLEQAKGYLELINNLNCTNGIKLKMITDVINKTFQLLFFQYKKYEKVGINCQELLDKTYNGIENLIIYSGMPIMIQTQAILKEYADAVRSSYLREYELIKDIK